MKVVVASPWNRPEVLNAIREAGHDVVVGGRPGVEQSWPFNDEGLIEHVQDADALLSAALTRPVMEAAPNLRAVVVPIIGYELVDLAAATERGILVCNSPSPENFVGVAEAAIGFMVAMEKRLKHCEALLRSGAWAPSSDRGSLCWHRTLGIIGFGRIGRQIAKRLAGWDMRLLAYDPFVTAETASEFGVTLVDLPTLLKESDVVTVHVPATPETRKLVGEAELRQMKPSAFLINTARGEIVDEAALVRAIKEDWIAGAALDVFDPEPLPITSQLRELDLERVILTPHNISHSPESLQGNTRMATESLLAVLRGEVPGTVVNPDAVPQWKERILAQA